MPSQNEKRLIEEEEKEEAGHLAMFHLSPACGQRLAEILKDGDYHEFLKEELLLIAQMLVRIKEFRGLETGEKVGSVFPF